MLRHTVGGKEDIFGGHVVVGGELVALGLVHGFNLIQVLLHMVYGTYQSLS
jgi:hypothetical protein